MASTTHFETDTQPGALRRFFRGIGNGMVTYMERQSRAGQIQRLQAKSDAELARMGLNRDQIVRHVFRDRFFI